MNTPAALNSMPARAPFAAAAASADAAASAGIAVARSGTQVALQEARDGHNVNRLEHVTDAQHGAR
ncbi:hypothetical protein KDW63_11485 [Burkholderia cenocepacia]|uniref:hypothetical protein n=1 Tax=Burkholderia cenocepacia TaxID=95486 RepID=UPI001B96408D|nr:hypothetical protein [Burkholderia cenocepacia]MBR8294803.1 hypothetical protein [Burkholderia cenocepacia]